MVSEDSPKEWKKGESNPGIWHWVLTATMSQPQVPRDQQCSQHCWVCAVVSWPWSSSVTLSERRSYKSGLGFFQKNSLHHVTSWSSLGEGRKQGGGCAYTVG